MFIDISFYHSFCCCVHCSDVVVRRVLTCCVVLLMLMFYVLSMLMLMFCSMLMLMFILHSCCCSVVLYVDVDVVLMLLSSVQCYSCSTDVPIRCVLFDTCYILFNFYIHLCSTMFYILSVVMLMLCVSIYSVLMLFCSMFIHYICSDVVLLM